MKTYSFFLKNKEFKIPRDMEILLAFPREISNFFIQNEKYFIKSNATNEVFETFLNYMITKESMPDINSDNYDQYQQLSIEFDILKDHLSKPEFKEIRIISNLKVAISMGNINKSIFEDDISANLDLYLDKYTNEMKNIPLSSLYNIFYNKKRILNDHEKAYQFIISNCANDNDQIKANSFFILLGSLEGSKLTKNSINECFLKKNDHFEFIPKTDFSYIEKINQQRIRLLYITINYKVLNLNFINQLNRENSKYVINWSCISADKELLYMLRYQKNYFTFFDIIVFGGCDNFAQYRTYIDERMFKDFILPYHQQGGIILFLHDFFSKQYMKIFASFGEFLGFQKIANYDAKNDDYMDVQFNASYVNKEVITSPFLIGEQIKIAKTHQGSVFDEKYTVLYDKKNNIHQYYTENLDKNIANIEIGHSIEITDNEKKLFYNIICHLFSNRNTNNESNVIIDYVQNKDEYPRKSFSFLKRDFE
ncbi:hypothetical protein M9Y10_016078 [Tritrichomonas musculus]|uniref:Uncharacterized protein n=1 Tax=Tritrichomonas musculus TaxID=1915356 RepID=A0ABR2I615_9EUKA